MKTGSVYGWYASSTVAPYSPMARSQVISSPARMPGAATRRLTRQNRASGRCPRVAARSSSAGSMAANAERAAMMRNGEATKVWARTTPITESVRPPLKNWPTVVYGPTR